MTKNGPILKNNLTPLSKPPIAYRILSSICLIDNFRLPRLYSVDLWKTTRWPPPRAQRLYPCPYSTPLPKDENRHCQLLCSSSAFLAWQPCKRPLIHLTFFRLISRLKTALFAPSSPQRPHLPHSLFCATHWPTWQRITQIATAINIRALTLRMPE